MTRQNSAKNSIRRRGGAGLGTGFLDLGFPSVDEVSYMHLKGAKASGHGDCLKEGGGKGDGVKNSKAYLEL